MKIKLGNIDRLAVFMGWVLVLIGLLDAWADRLGLTGASLDPELVTSQLTAASTQMILFVLILRLMKRRPTPRPERS